MFYGDQGPQPGPASVLWGRLHSPWPLPKQCGAETKISNVREVGSEALCLLASLDWKEILILLHLM